MLCWRLLVLLFKQVGWVPICEKLSNYNSQEPLPLPFFWKTPPRSSAYKTGTRIYCQRGVLASTVPYVFPEELAREVVVRTCFFSRRQHNNRPPFAVAPIQEVVQTWKTRRLPPNHVGRKEQPYVFFLLLFYQVNFLVLREEEATKNRVSSSIKSEFKNNKTRCKTCKTELTGTKMTF